MSKTFFSAAMMLIVTLTSIVFAKDIRISTSEKEAQGVGLKNSSGKLTFRAKQSELWFKHSATNDKKQEETAEVTLTGRFYTPPKKVSTISKKEVDRSTPEGLIDSHFSASKKGDLKWIVDNFIDEEQSKVKSVFENKKILKEGQLSAKKIEAEYLTGEADYKEHTLLFIEQQYGMGVKVTEAVACKKTEDGWKLTNALSADETFDIVFAALSSGRVTDPTSKPTKAKSK